MFHHYLAWYSVDFPRGSALIDGLFRAGKYGYLCLPVFFLISGFVILGSARARGASGFAIARFVRLYPVYWLCVSITAVVAIASGLGEAVTVDPRTFFVNLTMLQDFTGFESVDIVYWTLAVELQFYALVVLLLVFGVLDRMRVWLTIWLALVAAYHATGQPSFLPWLTDPAYAPFLIAGVAFSMIRRDGPSPFVHLILLATFAVSVYTTHAATWEYIPDPTILDRAVSVAGVIALFAAFYLVATKRVMMKPTALWIALGGLTYALYLLHNKAGKILMYFIEPRIGPVAAIAFTAAVALLVSLAIHLAFERPVSKALRARLLALAGGRRTSSGATLR